MRRAERFRSAARAAQRLEYERARAFAISKQELDQRRGQLEALLGYRSEYLAAFGALARGPMEIGLLRNFQGFMKQLDEAIGAQETLLRAAASEMERRHRLLCKARVRHKAVEHIVGRVERRQRRQEALNEQRELDDRSAYRASGPGGEKS